MHKIAGSKVDVALKTPSHSGTVDSPDASFVEAQDSNPNETSWVRIQRVMGWICLLPLSALIIALLLWRGRYRVLKKREIRRRFWEITRSRQPLIVCSNHLTMIDSIILIWALGSVGRYLLNYRLFCWNLPAVENTRKHRSWRFITYLSKCILVDRLGDAEHTGSILETVCHLLRRGDLVMLFPEGTRSRSGRVDINSVTYGVGKILQELPDCRVLCAYLRGRGQAIYSDFPKCGEVFSMELELIKPITNFTGLRGARDQSQQVVAKLREMEDRFFGTVESSNDRQ